MSSFALEGRVRVSIELALTAGIADPRLHDRQDVGARELGLSGAEIDAARLGRSFDVRTSIAIALALAARDGRDYSAERDRAARAGIDSRTCEEIIAFGRDADSPALAGVGRSV